MSKNLPYRCVGTVGHCLILAQILGEDPTTGEEIPSFFAAYMLKDGKPACNLAEATDILCISGDRNTYQDLVGYCHGFSKAARMWRGVSPNDWPYPGTIDPKNVWDLKHSDPEMKRLRAWPNLSEAAEVRGMSKTDYSREELIAICEASIVPVSQWSNRDSSGAQQQIGHLWALLKAGCDFKIEKKEDRKPEPNGYVDENCTTNERTIWVTVFNIPDFYFMDAGGEKASELIYLPTPERLEKYKGMDWY